MRIPLRQPHGPELTNKAKRTCCDDKPVRPCGSNRALERGARVIDDGDWHSELLGRRRGFGASARAVINLGDHDPVDVLNLAFAQEGRRGSPRPKAVQQHPRLHARRDLADGAPKRASGRRVMGAVEDDERRPVSDLKPAGKSCPR